jgi:hypothetical protein
MENTLNDFKNTFSSLLYGITKGQAHNESICIDCKQPVNLSNLSKRDQDEYRISGICPLCWDNMFKDDC